MIENTENYYNNLNAQYNNLVEILKIETDKKKIKLLEIEINKVSSLIKSLMSYINFYKLKK